MPYLGRDPTTGERPFDCAACRDPEHPRRLTLEQRAEWHCGFMDEASWRGPFPHPPQGLYVGPVCPGYLTQLRVSREAEIAVSAKRDGELRTFFPRLEATVLFAALELDGAWRRYEAEQMEKLKNR